MKKLFYPLIIFFILNSYSIKSQSFPGNYTSYKIEGKAIQVFADTESVRFTFYRTDILRVDFLPSPSTQFDSSFVVIRDTTNSININFAENDSSLVISSSSIKIICRKNPLRISYYNSQDKLLLSEPENGGIGFNQNQRIINFKINSGEHFYGTGERGTSLDKLGQAFDSFNTQIGGYSTPLSTMNINIPLIASTNGYGLYFEDTYPGRFDIGNSNDSIFTYTANGGEISYYLIVSPTIPGQLEAYTWLTGRQPLPPRWAFGYIQSKYGYRNESDAANMIQTMRQSHIPMDAIVLDLYWYKNMGDLSWDQTAWPNPFQMMDNFLSEGVKTILITEPYFTQSSSNYSAGDADGYFAKDGSGNTYQISNWWSCGCNAALIDITNPATQNWFWNKYESFMGSEAAGLWTDLGEPETDFSDMKFYLGSRDKVHNIFDLLWAKTIFNGYNKFRTGQRIFNLTRSGYAGIQRYGVIPWSGDVSKSFGGLAVQLPMLLNIGMSGLAYHNSDIGGFCCGTPSDELYVRWMEYGTFCPITRAHGIDTEHGTEPYSYSSQAEQICKDYIQLRYQLLPYIYTMAYQNYLTGLPLARPLFFDYPNDQNVSNLSSSYLWGDNFLVSPVVQSGQTSKSIYLPSGNWIYYWNDKTYKGGQNVTVSAPLNILPLFVKGGSIIPMQPVMDYSDEYPLDTLFLNIYPSISKTADFSLYEDDGKTLDYQTGSYSITDFSAQVIQSSSDYNIIVNIGKSVGTFSGKLKNRTYVSVIYKIQNNPSSVTSNGIELPDDQSYSSLRSSLQGYYFDPGTNKLYVQIYASIDSSYQLSINNIILNAGESKNSIPASFALEQNYPNPFNPTTTIRYDLKTGGKVTLKVFDLLGRELATLVNQYQNAGYYNAEFNGKNLSSGIYFYKLFIRYNENGSSGIYTESKKLILIK